MQTTEQLNSALAGRYAVVGVDRFLAEIQVTENLQHPNLLPLFDSGEMDGVLFYVMPFVEGESLRARLDREKQLPDRRPAGDTKKSLPGDAPFPDGGNARPAVYVDAECHSNVEDGCGQLF